MGSWKKGVYLSTVKTNDTSYNSAGSTAYAGVNSAGTKYVPENVAIMTVDTSDFPPESVLKYKKNKVLTLHTNFKQFYRYYNNAVSKIGVYIIKATGYYSNISAASLSNCIYDFVINNSKSCISKRDILGDENLNLTEFVDKCHHATMVFKLEKDKEDDYVYLASVNKSGTYLQLTYEDVVPQIEMTYSDKHLRPNTYTLSWKYSDELNIGQKSYKIVWKSSTGATGTVTGTGFSHTFPAYTFPVGTVSWSLTVYSNDDVPGTVFSTTPITVSNSVPTGTVTAPINGEQFYRANARTVQWNYSDTANVPQKSFSIEYTLNGVTKTVSQNTANKYYTFPAYALAAGTLTYYLTVTNNDGISTKSGPYTANAINSTPSAVASAPIDDATFNHAEPVTFKWSYSDPANAKQKSFAIEYTNGGVTKTVSQISQNNYYTFLKNTFSEGPVTYHITVTNNDGVSYKAGPYVANCVMSEPTAAISYPVNISVPLSQALTFTWTFSETVATGQKSYELKVTQNGTTKTYSGTGDEMSYTVPAYTFEAGNVSLVLKVTNNDNKSFTTAPSTFTVEPSYPTVEAVYPNGVLVKGDKACTFTWNYSETVDVGQTDFWIEITHAGTKTTYTQKSGNHHYDFAANTLTSGENAYTIKVLNADGQYATCGPYYFTVVNQTEAPLVTAVTNNAMPAITWTVSDQDAFEIIIKDNFGNTVYKSGLIVDSVIRTFTIDKLLKNGRYTIEMRALNKYGYYTNWGTYLFTLSATCQSSITSAFVFGKNDYGVSVMAAVSGGTAYVARRKQSEEDYELLGKYEDGFTDYTIPGNESYQYAIVLYDVGIIVSTWTVVKVAIQEVIIRDSQNPDNYVLIWLSEDRDFNLNQSDSREKTLIQCLGRKYPVKETGEWLSSVRSFSAYVTNEQYMSLKEMELSGYNVQVQSDGEYMLADISMEDNGKHMEDGRNISVTLTRVDDQEGL